MGIVTTKDNRDYIRVRGPPKVNLLRKLQSVTHGCRRSKESLGEELVLGEIN